MTPLEPSVLKRLLKALAAAFLFLPFSLSLAKNADLSAEIHNLSESSSATEPGQRDRYPEILVDGQNVHVFWFAYEPAGGHKVCYRRSLDRGETWQPTYVFYQQDLAMRDPIASPLERHLAVVNGTVHIVFGAYGGEGGGWFGQLVYLRSADNGATFGAPQVLWSSTGPWHAYGVRVASAAGKLAICYHRSPNWYDSLAAHVLISSDNGASFSDTVAATGGEGGSWTIEDFVFTGDMAAVLYLQTAFTAFGHKGDLHMAVSDDGGASFSSERISVESTDGLHRTNSSHDEHYSQVISCDAGRAHATWLGLDAAGANAIYYRRSTDGGQTWEAEKDLVAGTPIPAASLTRQNTIVTDGDLVCVLIHTSDSKLYLRKSVDGGANFGSLVEVTDPAGSSIAAGAWWPVMKRVATGTPGVKALDIVSTGLMRFRSLDDGTTFTTTAKGPLWAMRESHRPQFAADAAGNTHLVCEGVWTWYSTGVFGDADTLYTRFDVQPAPLSGSPQALQMVAARNPGDGSGYERNDGMLVGDDGALLPRAAFSIECWAKSQLATAGQENYYIQKQGPGSGGAWETILIGNWRGGEADMRLATEDGGYVLVGGDPIIDGAWHHLAMSYDSGQAGDNFRIYVDGEQVAATSASGLVKAGRGPLLLGAEPDHRAPGSLTLDDVRIWDHAVTPEQVRDRRNLTLTGSEAGLVAWYPLDASTRDATGHGHHGRLLYEEGFVTGVNGTPVGPSNEITGATILNGVLGQLLSYSIATRYPANSFSATGLPDGLELDPLSGVISGTPTSVGLSTVMLSATDSQGTSHLNLTLNVRGEETTLLQVDNIAGVSSGPPNPTTFTLAQPALITYLSDYHYFNGGVLPGTIGFRHSDGTLYGPWQTSGRIGQGGVLNAYWDAWPMVTIPAGSYTVEDSSPSTWSWNSQSGGRGFCTVRGISAAADDATVYAAWAANNGLSSADAEAEADPDDDDRPNWVEVGLGGHPLRRDPAPPGLITTQLGGRPAVAYTTAQGGFGVPGSDHVVNGVRIIIEVTQSLAAPDWKASIHFLDVAAADCANQPGGTEIVTVPVKLGSIGSPTAWFARQRFVRIAP